MHESEEFEELRDFNCWILEPIKDSSQICPNPDNFTLQR